VPSVVVGLDGAAWQLLQPLLDDGSMPHLASLVHNGAHGRLRSTVPPVTPPAWTSAVTGVNPGRHGIYGFHRGHAQYEHQELLHSGLVQAPTLWEMANEQGRSTGIYNLPMTYPPVPLNGWMISGFMTPGVGQHMTGFVYPADLEKKILSWEPDYTIEIKSNQEQDWRDAALAERALAALRQRYSVLRRLLDEHPVDIVFSVMETPDRLQHLYYRYMDPAEEMYRSDAAARIRPTITRCFEMMDKVAQLLHEYAGEDGGVIVCSDHGFTAWDVSVHTNALLEDWGYLKLRGSARLMQNRFISGAVPLVRRVLPTKVRREAKRRTFGAIDWSQTRAFASVYYQEGVFLNVSGRERFGIVPPSDIDTLKTEIEQRFRSLKGPDGNPVVDAVFRSEDVFSGEALEGAPDLIMFMRDHNYVPDDEVFHKDPFTDHRSLPRGGHHPDGIVVVAGRGIRPARIQASIVDVTPTLLYMAGLKVPEGLDGAVMTDAFAPEHLETHPVEPMPAVNMGIRDESSPYSVEEEAMVEESLRGLGYL
jgi:predicted AlkP superfamily phosphohydrolase/phosphomutase